MVKKARLRIDRTNRRLCACLAVVVIALIVLGVVLMPHDRTKSGVPAPSAAKVAVEGPATSAAAAPTAVQPAASSTAASIALCGGGSVTLRPDGEVDPVAYGKAVRIEAESRRIVAALHGDGSDIAEAAAHFIVFVRLGSIATGPSDGGDESRAALQSLASLALASPDPRVYALALRSCDRAGGIGACGALSAEQWAKLDPDNAAPWMALAEKAALAHEDASVADAMAHVAAAHRLMTDERLVPSELAKHTTSSEAAMLADVDLLVGAIGSEAAHPQMGYVVTNHFCAAPEMSDPSRRQACAAIGQLLDERSDSMLAMMIGAHIRQRVDGWDDRVDLLRAEINGYSGAQAAESLGFPNAQSTGYGCDVVRPSLERLRVDVRESEPTRLRAWVAASGKRPDELLNAYRASIASAAGASSTPNR